MTDPGSTYRLIDLPGRGPEDVVVDGNGFILTGLRAAAVLVMPSRQQLDDLAGPERSLAVLSGRGHQGSCPFPCEACTVRQLTTPC